MLSVCLPACLLTCLSVWGKNVPKLARCLRTLKKMYHFCLSACLCCLSACLPACLPAYVAAATQNTHSQKNTKNWTCVRRAFYLTQRFKNGKKLYKDQMLSVCLPACLLIYLCICLDKKRLSPRR